MYETNFGVPQHEDGAIYNYPNLLEFGDTTTPPLATPAQDTAVDFVAYWYNDFGLDHVALSSNSSNGWWGWYDWRWNFPTNTGDGLTTMGYDEARHPLQGFYKGDNANVLGWQCYWLAEAAKIRAVAITQSAGFTSSGWSNPSSGSYWVYQLFNNVPNFQALKFALALKCSGTKAEIEAQNTDLVNQYINYSNAYVYVENNVRYAVVTAWEFEQIRGVYDAYNGQVQTVAYLKGLANKFKAAGYGGVCILARNPGLLYASVDPTLKPAGCYIMRADYENTYGSATSTYSNQYSNYAANAVFPNETNRVVNLVTAAETQFPHGSGWTLNNSTPVAFQQVAQRAVNHVISNNLKKMITVYNVSEWAEGGPGLIPNKKDGFGYLDALGTVASDEGVTAAKTLNWGAIARGDEFNYVGPPDSNKWSVYNSVGHAGNGIRSPGAIACDGQVMRISSDANGTTGGMSSRFDLGLEPYYRVETRMRTSTRHPEYHPVMLLWPDDAGSVTSGVPEVDYAEGTGDTTKIKFFLHYGESSQTQAEQVLDTTQWHNYAVEWSSTAVVGYIDGVEWFRDEDPAHIPTVPMHSTLQLDWFPNDSPDTNPPPSWMEVAWTRQYNIVTTIPDPTPPPPGSKKMKIRYVSSSGSDSNAGTQAAPWKTLARIRSAFDTAEIGRGDAVLLKRGDTFYGNLSIPGHTGSTGFFTLGAYGTGTPPKVSGYKISNNAWTLHQTNIWRLNITANSGAYTGNTGQASTNVGFLKVNGEIKGWKKWSIASMGSDWDFYSDSTYVYVRKSTSPGAGVHIAVNQTGIRVSPNTHVKDLHVLGHGAHGMAIYSNKNVQYTNNLIEEIGGSMLSGTTRFGNGIEIWIGTSDVLIEGNTIRQTYDVGLTMQGTVESTNKAWNNIWIRKNRFENCNQTFEVWSRGTPASDNGWINCHFVDNISVDPGYSWAALIRSDSIGRGTHLLTYDMELPCDLEIARNVFFGARHNYSYSSTLPTGIDYHDNSIHLAPGQKLYYQTSETIEQYAAYRSRTGTETGTEFFVTPTTIASTNDAFNLIASQSAYANNCVRIQGLQSWASDEMMLLDGI